MTNRKAAGILAAFLLAVVLGAAALYRFLPEWEVALPSGQQSASQQEESAAAPDFTMLDDQENTVAFSDYAGRPIVLNFWASWCGPCKEEMPAFDAVAAELAEEVDFMMVNLTDGGRETVKSASRFIEEQGYSFPVYYDTRSEGAAAYAVRSIPATYFIDAEGNVLAYAAGGIDEESLRRGIDLILKQ